MFSLGTAGPIWSFLFPLLLHSNSCTAQVDLQKCLPDGFDITEDIYPEETQSKLEHSNQATIRYEGTRKYLEVNGVASLLYQCGTDPTTGEIKKYKGKNRIPLPVQGVVLTSTTQIPYLEYFNLLDKVKAVIGMKPYISSPCLLDKINNFDIEVFESMAEYVEKKDDNNGHVALGSPVILGNGWSSYSELPAPWKVIHTRSSWEATAEGALQWHEVVGSLFNLESTASKKAEEALKKIKCVQKHFPAPKKGKDKVAWGYKTTYGDEAGWGWDVPDVDACDQEQKPWYCNFLARCSGVLLTPKTKGSRCGTWSCHLSDDEFVEYAKDADILIYTSPGWNSVYDSDEKKLIGIDGVTRIGPPQGFKFLKKHQVYDTVLNGENNWFEDRFAQQDIVQADFCAAVSGSKVIKGKKGKIIAHKRKFLRNVFYPEEQSREIGTCGEDPLKSCKDTLGFKWRVDKKYSGKCESLKNISDYKKRLKECDKVAQTKVKKSKMVWRRIGTGCQKTCGYCWTNKCYKKPPTTNVNVEWE